MKKIILMFSIITTLFSTVASAASLKEFAGNYEVSADFMNIVVQGTMGVDTEGNIKFNVSSPYIFLNCTGTSEMINDELVSTPTCDGATAITLKVNLKNETNYSKFQAPVYSSLINADLQMNFTRL